MEQMHVEPIRFKDVRGNELLYIKIKKGEKEVLINVGNRTFKNVEELINPPQPELPLRQKLEQKQYLTPNQIEETKKTGKLQL